MLNIEHAQASVGYLTGSNSEGKEEPTDPRAELGAGQCVADQGTDRHFWIRIVCNAPGGNPFWT